MDQRTLQSFEATIAKRPDGCWIWTASTTANGYAQKWVGAHNKLAHRLSYEHFVGPIPAGMTIDHACRHRACVNPAHLEAVDNRTNVLRGIGHTAINARKKRCLRGHPFSPENTYVSRNGWRNCRACRAIRETLKTA